MPGGTTVPTGTGGRTSDFERKTNRRRDRGGRPRHHRLGQRLRHPGDRTGSADAFRQDRAARPATRSPPQVAASHLQGLQGRPPNSHPDRPSPRTDHRGPEERSVRRVSALAGRGPGPVRRSGPDRRQCSRPAAGSLPLEQRGGHQQQGSRCVHRPRPGTRGPRRGVTGHPCPNRAHREGQLRHRGAQSGNRRVHPAPGKPTERDSADDLRARPHRHPLSKRRGGDGHPHRGARDQRAREARGRCPCRGDDAPRRGGGRGGGAARKGVPRRSGVLQVHPRARQLRSHH